MLKRIADIKIGKRVRKTFGDIDLLAESISDRGLLQPIGIRPDGSLVCGERRIRAFKKLGKTEIPVHVCKGLEDELRYLEAERDENSCRVELTPVEASDLAERLTPMYEKQAKAAQEEGQKKGAPAGGKTSGRGRKKIASGETSTKGKRDNTKRTAQQSAKSTGYSAATLKKVEKIKAAAKESPAIYGPLLKELGKPGCKVDAVFKQFKAAQRSEVEKEAIKKVSKCKTIDEALQDNRFSTIVADPPWNWDDEGDVSQFGRGRTTYGAMSFDELLKFPLGEYGDNNSHLYLWITNRSLPKGFALLEAWGYRYVTCLTWCKPSIGMGNYFRGSTEQILFAVRGTLPLKCKDKGTWFSAPRGKKHSAKPIEFFQLVEQCSPGPYLELFARSKRDGWMTWGGEIS